jgi:hypothetical protein
MKKIIFYLIFTAFLALFSVPQTAQAADKLTMAGASGVLKTEEDLVSNQKTKQLQAFLEAYRSPLAPYARVFVEKAEQYQIDWRLVPAITGVESTFGRQIPYNSYNAYGWANGKANFGSWEESIEKVTKTLKEKYYNRGLDNPYKIGPVYAPPSRTWAGKVSHFMDEIENFKSGQKIASLTLTI